MFSLPVAATALDWRAHATVGVLEQRPQRMHQAPDSGSCGGAVQHQDLFSSDYFAKKLNRLAAEAKDSDFTPWAEARERYIKTKLEPIHDLYRQSDHDWFKDFSRRRGVAMHSSDLIYRLQKLNPHISVQQQINFPDDWGLYTTAYGRIQFLTGLPKNWLTEFSYALVDERNLPLEERRGWRTVLVYLLYKGALEWDDVFREFGDPMDGFNDERWCAATADIRLGGDEQVQRNIANLVES